VNRWTLLGVNLRRHWPAITVGTALMLLAAAASLAPPLVIRDIIDGAIARRDAAWLSKLVLVLAGLLAVSAGVGLTAEWVFLTASQKALHAIRRVVFSHVLALPVEYLERTQTGYLTARMSEVSSLGVLFNSGTFRIAVSLFQFAGAAVILLRMNPRLTLLVFAFLPLYYLATRFLAVRYRRASKAYLQRYGVMSGQLQETFQGMSEVKNLGVEDKRAKEATHLSDEVARAATSQGRVGILGSGLLSLVTGLITVGVLYLSGRSIIAGTFTLGGYMAFSAYVGQLLGPFHYVMSFAYGLQPALAALDRVAEFLREGTEPERDEAKADPGRIQRIEFRDVSFAYPSRPDRDVLRGVQFAVGRPGVLRIAGANGTGKSTLVRLLLGYNTGYRGQILVNGRELRELNILALRRRMGIVSQEPFLFDGTVRENLELACDGKSGLLQSGSFDSGLEDGLIGRLIDHLPQGLETLVGEGGGRLSGGQRQTVAILRAFVRGSDVVVLDEVTAHLDPEVKGIVREASRSLFADRLCIIITPRRAPLDPGQVEVVLGRSRAE